MASACACERLAHASVERDVKRLIDILFLLLLSMNHTFNVR